jgi:hypothetical protein
MALEDLFAKPPTAPDVRQILSLMELLQQERARADRIPPPAASADTGSPTGGGTFPRIIGGTAAGSAEPPAQPSSYRASAMWAVSPYDDHYAAEEKANNLPEGYLKGTGFIESGHNPRARSGSNRGLMQLGFPEEKQTGANAWDPISSIKGAAQIAAGNQFAFRQSFGRDPSAGELYVMHQQGRAGGMALMNPANADQPAWQVIRPYYGSNAIAQKAIIGNGGNLNMTANQFANHWSSRFGPVPSLTAFVSPRVSRGAMEMKPWSQLTEQEKKERARQSAEAPITTSPGALAYSGVPGMAQGGVITDPAIVVDQRTRRPIATIAENGPEAVMPQSDALPAWLQTATAGTMPPPMREPNIEQQQAVQPTTSDIPIVDIIQRGFKKPAARAPALTPASAPSGERDPTDIIQRGFKRPVPVSELPPEARPPTERISPQDRPMAHGFEGGPLAGRMMSDWSPLEKTLKAIDEAIDPTTAGAIVLGPVGAAGALRGLGMYAGPVAKFLAKTAWKAGLHVAGGAATGYGALQVWQHHGAELNDLVKEIAKISKNIP